MISALSAARALCEMSGWDLSNLKLQKILYIAHMLYLGRHGQPLIDKNFEAWEYGPVVPAVYQRLRGFGSEPVGNVFHWEPELSKDTEEYKALKQAFDTTKEFSAGQLVSITHSPKGAWYKVYEPSVRGIVIPNDMILEEYRVRSPEPAA